jgi:hypothetical protein
MSLSARVAAFNSGTIYCRDFSPQELRGLCPIIGAIPSIIHTVLEKRPKLELNEDFRAAHIEFTFDIWDADDKKHASILMLNVGEQESSGLTAQRAELTLLRAENATLKSRLAATPTSKRARDET